MSKIIKKLKKLFGHTSDRQYDAIHEEDIHKPLKEATRSIKSDVETLRRNGFTIQVYNIVKGSKNGH